MNSRDLVYWLQGLFELGDVKTLNEEQTACIKRHVALVFAHEIDPAVGAPAHQTALNEIHSPRPPIGGTHPSGAKLRC